MCDAIVAPGLAPSRLPVNMVTEPGKTKNSLNSLLHGPLRRPNVSASRSVRRTGGDWIQCSIGFCPHGDGAGGETISRVSRSRRHILWCWALVIGVVIAVTGGSTVANLSATALGAAASASASASPSATPRCATGSRRHDDRHDQRQLRHHRPGEPAARAGPGHPVPAHRYGRADSRAVRVHDDQRGQPRGLRAGHDPEPGHGQALRLRPAGHHEGHHPGRGTGGAGTAESTRSSRSTSGSTAPT